VKDLPKGPTWRLERDSNLRPFGRKASNLQMRHLAPQSEVIIKAVPNIRFVFSSEPKSGLNSYSVFGQIVPVEPDTNSGHVTSVSAYSAPIASGLK